ncbi:MAG: zinc ribbon domain-containing protein [Opitutales bacterium]|nr:zinc ribbon domain-containing protein [Opitutales bacterium]MCH8540564.1 zinc ribbon domain-containing protein [Opitutales bacterium]
MPTYDYICDSCGHDLEVFQSMKDDPLKDCPSCGQPALRRRIGAGAGLIFKGSGFYITDYKKDQKGGSKDSGEKTNAEPSAKKSSTESKVADSVEKSTSGKVTSTP